MSIFHNLRIFQSKKNTYLSTLQHSEKNWHFSEPFGIFLWQSGITCLKNFATLVFDQNKRISEPKNVTSVNFAKRVFTET
jgi:hypothetical protein